MKRPPANASIQAIALRVAAINFGRHVDDELDQLTSPDVADVEGQKRNRALLRAARAYTKKAGKTS